MMEIAREGPLEPISLEIGDQEFCIDVSALREIRGRTPATPLRQTSSSVHGVINPREAIMPVVDLRDRPDLGQPHPASRHVIVAVRHDERMAGPVVDTVQETSIETSGLPAPLALSAPTEDLSVKGRKLSRLMVGALLSSTRAA